MGGVCRELARLCGSGLDDWFSTFSPGQSARSQSLMYSSCVMYACQKMDCSTVSPNKMFSLETKVSSHCLVDAL